MRPSTVIALIGGAALAAASPILHLHKKAVVWDVVVETVYVTVTNSHHRPSTRIHGNSATTVVVKSTVYVSPIPAPTVKAVVPAPPPPPPAAPTTAAPAPVVVAPVPAAEPAPQVQVQVQAPAPEVQAPAPVVQAPAPVVQAPAPEPAAAAPPTDLISAALFNHNKHRQVHGASDLTWDDQLANSAQILSDRCAFGHDTSIGGGGYGQNIAMMSQNDVATVLGASISDMWYQGEVANFKNLYDQANPQVTGGEFRHFTQIVWKSSSRLGCGVSSCGSSSYIVCNYASAGNYAGEYAQNVGRPSS